MNSILDTSRVPPELLAQPAIQKVIAGWEKDVHDLFNSKMERSRISIHEAAHAEYMLRAGADRVTLGPPELAWDVDDREIKFFSCSVVQHYDAGQAGWPKDVRVVAKIHVSGGVAERLLVGQAHPKNDESDFKDFILCAKHMFGLSDKQIVSEWEASQRDVAQDMRSPAFRRQLWERAREYDRQLLAMLKKPQSCYYDEDGSSEPTERKLLHEAEL